MSPDQSVSSCGGRTRQVSISSIPMALWTSQASRNSMTAAIGETVGDCGILWDDRDPILLAEPLAMLAQDEATTADVAQQAYRRYEQMFSNTVTETQFLESMHAVGLEV